MSELPFKLSDALQAAEFVLKCKEIANKMSQDSNFIASNDENKVRVNTDIEEASEGYMLSFVNTNDDIICADNVNMELEECELYLKRNVSKEFRDEKPASLIYLNFEKNYVQLNGHGFGGAAAIYNTMVLKKKNWNVRAFCFGSPKITDKVYDGIEIYSFYFNDDYLKYYPSESPYIQIGTIVDIETLECTQNPSFIPKPEIELQVHPIEDYIAKLKTFV